MAKTKWIQNPDPDSFGNLTGKVKLTTYLNGVRNGETYINTQDSDIHYEVERLTDRGYKVKILHEVCSKSQTPLYYHKKTAWDTRTTGITRIQSSK